MKSVYFTPEHEAFRERARELIAREVIPHADSWERSRCIPREVWRRLGHAGLLGLRYPEAYGGSNRDIFHSLVLLEELGRTGYAGFRIAVAVHAYMATAHLAQFGSDALKHRYLAPAIAGEAVGALAITEPEAGSDLGRLQTTAVRDGDDLIVDGVKKFVANGTTADFITLAVSTEKPSSAPKRGVTGISLLIVDGDAAGLSRKKLDIAGWYCLDTAELRLEGVRVPARNVIGSLNHGFYYLMQCFQLERLAAGVLAIGGMDHCLEITRERMASRVAFQERLIRFQALRHRMADLMTEVEAARQLAYHAAWLYQQGELPITECSMAKLNATELASRVARECLQFHGAYGCLEESSIARVHRDSQAATITAGTSEIMREIIAQATFEEAAVG